MMIKVAIVEDDDSMLERIFKKMQEILSRLSNDFTIDIFRSSDDILAHYTKYNLICLDIVMPNLSGIEIAQKIRLTDIYNEIELIFITNQDQMIFQTQEFSPFRFIRKSEFDSEITPTLVALAKKLIRQKSELEFVTEKGKVLITSAKIMYIESKGHKLILYLDDKTIVANGSLKKMEKELSDNGFIRVHNSYMVNFRYINITNYKNVILNNRTEIPISRGKYEFVRMETIKFLREK